MQFVCDAPGGKTWFRIESEAEATQESATMNHAVEKYFRREREKVVQSYKPASQNAIERDIGLGAHVAREMALFLTLRDRERVALTTAMLPPQARGDTGFRTIIVGAVQWRSVYRAWQRNCSAGSALRTDTQPRKLFSL